MGPVGNARRALRAAKLIYPLALAAYRRWDQLSPQEKERYKRQARGYAEQSAHFAKAAVESLRDRGHSGSGRRR